MLCWCATCGWFHLVIEGVPVDQKFKFLPVVLYESKTWSLTLREKRRLRAFENGVLRRIFGPKWDKVTGECRKLHNEELNKLYC